MPRENMITEAEWEVMEVLWMKSPITSRQIISTLEDRGWRPTTIRTLLSRLIKKKYVGFTEGEYAYTYHTLVDRNDFVAVMANQMIHKLYNGNLSSLVAAFMERDALSEKDMEELKKIFDLPEKK
ncbi:MAG: BlaI/MecI/CopY family transcriptional regulator [Clostridia bacterium]